LKKRWSILTLAVFLGFGIFLISRWDEVAKLEAANHTLEARIARIWRETVAKRLAATHSVEARKERFQLRKLASVLIDARAEMRTPDAEELALQDDKISKLTEEDLANVIDELQASEFPDDVRLEIVTMLAAALLDRGRGESGQDALIHRFFMKSRVTPALEISRPLVERMVDTDLRTEVLHRLKSPSSP
jgi:hypothetical protein